MNCFRGRRAALPGLLALLLLNGCNAESPACDSSDTRDAVVKIVSGDSTNALADYAAKNSAVVKARVDAAGTEDEKQAILAKARQVVSYRLGDSIVTTSKTKDKRTVTCSAALSASLEDTKAQKTLDYKVDQPPHGNATVSVSPFQFPESAD